MGKKAAVAPVASQDILASLTKAGSATSGATTTNRVPTDDPIAKMIEECLATEFAKKSVANSVVGKGGHALFDQSVYQAAMNDGGEYKGSAANIFFLNLRKPAMKTRHPHLSAALAYGEEHFGESRFKDSSGKFRNVMKFENAIPVASFNKDQTASIGSWRKLGFDLQVVGFLTQFHKAVVGKENAENAETVAVRELFLRTSSHCPINHHFFDNTVPDVETSLVNFTFQTKENCAKLAQQHAPLAWDFVLFVHEHSKMLSESGQDSSAESIEQAILRDVTFAKGSEYAIKRGSRRVEECLMMFKRIDDAGIASLIEEANAAFEPKDGKREPLSYYSKLLLLVQKAGTNTNHLKFLVEWLFVRLQRGYLQCDVTKANLKVELNSASSVFDISEFIKDTFRYPDGSSTDQALSSVWKSPLSYSVFSPRTALQVVPSWRL